MLLEPLIEVETWAPEETLGDVMGDLSARRGHILGTDRDGRLTRVRSIVPAAELYRYSTALHSITHGRGTHKEKFHGFAEAPPEVTRRSRPSRRSAPSCSTPDAESVGGRDLAHGRGTGAPQRRNVTSHVIRSSRIGGEERTHDG